MTQYVKAKFKPDSKESYSYHNDHEPVAPGDVVRVETKHGEKKVTVVSVSDEKPNLKTKPVLGKVEPEAEGEAVDAPEAPESEASAAPAEPESEAEEAPARGLGDNRPPPYDPDAIETFEPKVQDFADAAGSWLDLGEIADEEQAAKLNDYKTGCRKLWKQIDEKRKADKEPHLEAERLVDKAYKPLLDPLKRAVQRVQPMLDAYTNKKAAEEEARRKAEIEKARQEAEEARKAAEAAEGRHDVAGESEAAEKLAAAEKAEKEAERAKTTGQIASATGGGRTAALRTYRSAKITGQKQALVWALGYAEVELMELVERLANRAIREGAREIPGVEIVEEKRVA